MGTAGGGRFSTILAPRGMLRLRTPTQWYKNHVSKDRPGMGRASRADPTLYAENEFA